MPLCNQGIFYISSSFSSTALPKNFYSFLMSPNKMSIFLAYCINIKLLILKVAAEILLLLPRLSRISEVLRKAKG